VHLEICLAGKPHNLTEELSELNHPKITALSLLLVRKEKQCELDVNVTGEKAGRMIFIKCKVNYAITHVIQTALDYS